MPIFAPEKAISRLSQTVVILGFLLRDVDAEQARRATDGADGWNIPQIVGHLRDDNEVCIKRTRLMLDQPRAPLPTYDQLALVNANHYAEQDIADVFARFASERRTYVALLSGLSADQWNRTGLHPTWGEVTVVEHATNGALHDINHIEQIVKALNFAGM